jgi:hypothetical protein
LPPATAHNYQVIALDLAGNASEAATLAISTSPDGSPPETPLGFTGIPSATSILLSWSASTDNVAVSGYRIRRNGDVIATVQGLSFLDSGLIADTPYQYELIALDEALNASIPALLTVSTLADGEAPGAPGDLAGSADYYSIALSWSAPGGNTAVQGYQIRRNGDLIATVPGLQFTDIDLPGGFTQNYQVRAIGAGGTLSDPASLTISTIEFEEWLDDHGLAGQTAGDSDQGGLDNLTEFQLGLDPKDPADDLGFRLECAPAGAIVRISYPALKPVGHFHLHRSDTLEDIANPLYRVNTLTPAQIRAMTPAERIGHRVEIPDPGTKGFFVLVFEPLAD